MKGVFIFPSTIRGCFKSSVFLIFLTLFLNQALAQKPQVQWLQKKSRHFIVYHRQEAIPADIKQILRTAEDYYEEIVESLGFRRFDFWTWDNRCKIFLYLSQDEYYNDTEQPKWSAGGVVVDERKISTYTQGEDFLDAVLPHEMGHLIFREFVGQKKKLPLWLDEGVACLNEIKYKAERLSAAKRLVKLNRYIPLSMLNRMNDPKTIILTKAFYAQSASVVNFLVTEFGDNAFFEFSRKIRDHQPWESALKDVYGFISMEELDKAWAASLRNEN